MLAAPKATAANTDGLKELLSSVGIRVMYGARRAA